MTPRVAVVGHVEVVEFARVERLPAQGEIVSASETWVQAAGGGGVAAVELAALAGESTLFVALGDDAVGRSAAEELEGRGVRVAVVWRPPPQRRAFTFVDRGGERTITLLSPKLHPHGADALSWDGLDATDAVYFTAGDVAALRQARRARVLVATARELPTLAAAGVQIDALVHSGVDSGETYRPGDLDPRPRADVATAGSQGGSFTIAGGAPTHFPPAAAPGPLQDAYGAGDSFAAGLTYGLAEGLPMDEAVALAARSGAAALSRRGAHGA